MSAFCGEFVERGERLEMVMRHREKVGILERVKGGDGGGSGGGLGCPEMYL